MAVESGWLDADGLPGRPWSRRLIYGMRMNVVPLMPRGLIEAIEREDWPGARDQMSRLADALQRNAALLAARKVARPRCLGTP